MDFKNYFALLINEATREDIKKFYPQISDKDYNTILDKDPTGTKTKVGNLSRLVLDLYKKDKFDIKGEQLHDVYVAFELIQKKKHLLTNTEFKEFGNLNLIPDAKTLMDINYYLNQLDNGKIKLKATDGQNVEIFYEDENWKVLIPLDCMASVRIGRDVGNAEWCTASSKAMCYYNQYIVRDDLYIFVNKHTNEAYQYFDHGGKIEFSNIKNHPANLEEFISKNKLKSVLSEIQAESEKIQTNKNYYSERLLKRYEQTKSPYMVLSALDKEGDDLVDKLFKIYKPDLDKKILMSVGAENEFEDEGEIYSTLNLELNLKNSKHTTFVEGNKKALETYCLRFRIENYTISSDLLISVKGDVNLIEKINTKHFPIKFKVVSGSFYCGGNETLTSLEGSPEEVGYFECTECTSLTSLKGGPKIVKGNYNCDSCGLKSLEGIPKIVGGNFNCSDNSEEFSEEEVRELCQVKGKVYV